MGVLLDARHEKVAQELSRGKTAVEASKAAGYPPGSSFASGARKRANRADIKLRMLEIATLTGVKETADSAFIQRKMVEIMNTPIKGVKAENWVSAGTLLAKIGGFMAPEKLEHSLNGLGARLDAARRRTNRG